MSLRIAARLLLPLGMVVAALLPGLATGWVAPPGAAAQDPANGQQLFNAQGCSFCHGQQGEGRFQLKGTFLSLEEVALQIRFPRGTMPFFSQDQLSDEGIADIYAWLTSQ